MGQALFISFKADEQQKEVFLTTLTQHRTGIPGGMKEEVVILGHLGSPYTEDGTENSYHCPKSFHCPQTALGVTLHIWTICPCGEITCKVSFISNHFCNKGQPNNHTKASTT